MIWKQIYLEPDQAKLLKQVAHDTGLTEAELIRQALDQQAPHLCITHRDLAAWEQERAFIERLIQQGPIPGKRAWRREELYDR